MFIVFVIKFDLSHPFYILILLMRFTAVVSVFLVQIHTDRLYLNKFSGGSEMLLMTTVMVLSYFLPHFDLANYTTHSILLHIIDALRLHTGVFMKLVLLVYFIGVPMTFIYQVRFVKQQVKLAK